MKNERIIEVSREFYADLAIYMRPEERWFDAEKHGIVLYAVSPDGDTRKLVFKVAP